MSVQEQTGSDKLDSWITALDFDALERGLEGFFVRQSNSALRGGATSGFWRNALAFVRSCVTRLSRSAAISSPQIDEVHSRLLRLERLYSSLHMRRAKRPQTIRALPAAVLTEVYELIDPQSARNPFRTESIRWRNFVLILLMLHQGLRRSEALSLPADAVKSDWNPKTRSSRFWLDIAENTYDDTDPRSDRPALKNDYVFRQIPLSEELAGIITLYITSYRGKPNHSFLLSTQKGSPMSKRSVNAVCTTLSTALSPKALKSLAALRKTTHIRPHDFRHTCAVVRLRHFVDAGNDMDLALQKLRTFFGWSRESRMPQRYAHAYFEERIATVWHDSFDSYVDALKELDRGDSQ